MKQFAMVALPLVLASGLAGQSRIQFGLKGGGISPRPAFSSPDESKRYTFGPSVEVRLPGNFAVEFNPLYKRVGYSSLFLVPTGPEFTEFRDFRHRLRGNRWEFPVIGKYYFRDSDKPLRPFLGTGYSLTKTWASLDTEVSSRGSSSSPERNRYDYTTRTVVGAVVGAGLRWKTGRLGFLPEIRYTYWGAENNLLRKNQAEVLFGIQF